MHSLFVWGGGGGGVGLTNMSVLGVWKCEETIASKVRKQRLERKEIDVQCVVLMITRFVQAAHAYQ